MFYYNENEGKLVDWKKIYFFLKLTVKFTACFRVVPMTVWKLRKRKEKREKEKPMFEVSDSEANPRKRELLFYGFHKM